MEFSRPSIAQECADAFDTHCASLVRVRQIFDQRAPDETDTFARECTPAMRDALASLGFDAPQAPVIDAASRQPPASASESPQDGAPATVQESTPDAAETSALARILAFFGIGNGGA